MTDRELRKLDRAGLLQLLLEQSKEAEALRAQVEALQAEVRAAKEEQPGIVLAPENAGSIAEAALKMTDVFAQAQKAADEYLKNIALMHEQQAERAAQLERESEQKAQALISEAEEKCRRMEAETQKKCEEIIRQAEADAGRNWREMQEKIEGLRQSSDEMQSMLKNGKKRFLRG